MPTCIRCNGTGENYFDDNGEGFEPCYHCGGSGQVEEKTYHSDMLQAVASAMGWEYAKQYRKYRNEDSDGEGFDFCAAENGMSAYDYMKVLAWNQESDYYNQLIQLSMEAQKEYIRKLTSKEVIVPLEEEQG